MPIAIDPRSVRRYVLSDERKLIAEGKLTRDAATKFLLKTMSIETEGRVARATQEGTHETLLITLREGLVGWENFRDARGIEVPFVVYPADHPLKGQPTDETLERVPRSCRGELMAATMELSNVSESEREQ